MSKIQNMKYVKQKKVKKYEHQIDKMVYKLYGLTKTRLFVKRVKMKVLTTYPALL